MFLIETQKQNVIASEAWQSPTYRAVLHSLGLPRFARKDGWFYVFISKHRITLYTPSAQLKSLLFHLYGTGYSNRLDM